MQKFIPAFFISDKDWEKSTCPSTCAWKQTVVFLYNGILLSHKDKLSVHVTIQIIIHNIMLSEKSHKKTTYCMVPFIRGFRKGKSIETEGRSKVVWDWGQKQEITENQHEGTSCSDGQILNFELGWWGYNCMHLIKITNNWILLLYTWNTVNHLYFNKKYFKISWK